MKKIISIILSAVACLCLVACGDKGPGIDVPDLDNGYTYTKQNTEGLMQFYSGDASLDAFVNEYMKRHLRYDEETAISSLKLGESKSGWREWEAMSVMWMNTAGIGYSPKDTIANWVSTITMDDFGYVWVDNGSTTTDWGQGWSFPSFGHSYGGPSSGSYYLNTSYFNGTNNITGISGSNPLSDVWKGESDTGVVAKKEKAATGYYDAMVISGNDMKKITYTYDAPAEGTEVPEDEPVNLVDNGNTILKPFMATAFCAPFLELDFSLTDYDSLGVTNQVKDVTVWWKGGSKTKNTEWDNDHMVKYSEFSSNYKSAFSSATHIVFPMYANEYWGTSDELDDAITDMKIELEFKNGINAEVRLEEVTLTFDSRQVLNNCALLSASAYYFEFTQDTEWLQNNMDRIRKAMQFLLTYCKGDTQSLITTEDLPGHDGSTNYDYYGDFKKTARKDLPLDYHAVGHGIGDGYWDCPSNPTVSMYVNINYYKALTGMQYLESMYKAAGLTESGNEIKVRTADMTDYAVYSETAESLAKKAEDFIPAFRTEFWNGETKRFHNGLIPADDPAVVAGLVDRVADYGFTTYNQECIELGLATPEQARDIMDWINGTRKVEGDTADNSVSATTGKPIRSKEIYRYEFAPRWTTKENKYQFWYRFSGNPKGQYAWDAQIQNGGTAIHCAYYDIVAENAVGGVDTSYAKLKKIQSWYENVKEAGGRGINFYRKYYDDLLIKLQGNLPGAGGDSSGVIGLDCEFLEASLLVTAIPEAYFGLGSTEYGILDITPSLPSDLDWWKMENVSYGGVNYDLTIGGNFVQINSIEGDSSALKVKVALDAPADGKAFEVRQHNKILVKDTDYRVENGKVIITAPFVNGRIQIIEK